jgi:hypothetical protein
MRSRWVVSGFKLAQTCYVVDGRISARSSSLRGDRLADGYGPVLRQRGRQAAQGE